MFRSHNSGQVEMLQADPRYRWQFHLNSPYTISSSKVLPKQLVQAIPLHSIKPDTQATSETLLSMDASEIKLIPCRSHVVRISHQYSTGSNSSLQYDTIDDQLGPEILQHSEAHTSHEFEDSLHPSIEA